MQNKYTNLWFTLDHSDDIEGTYVMLDKEHVVFNVAMETAASKLSTSPLSTSPKLDRRQIAEYLASIDNLTRPAVRWCVQLSSWLTYHHQTALFIDISFL